MADSALFKIVLPFSPDGGPAYWRQQLLKVIKSDPPHAASLLLNVWRNSIASQSPEGGQGERRGRKRERECTKILFANITINQS